MRRNRLFVAAALGAGLLQPSAVDAQDLLATCQGIDRDQIEIRNLNAAAQASGYDDEVRDQLATEVSFLCSQVALTLSNVQPTIGIAFSGGNPVLGTASTLGTRLGFIPRFSLTARANAALAELPDFFDATQQIGQIDSPDDQLQPVPTTNVPIGALQGDVAIGVFGGIPLAPTLGSIGAVDLLGSLSFIPMVGPVEDAGLEEAILNFGGGARLGILSGGALMPAVSVSGMYRRMGEVQFGDIEAGDPGQFATDLSVLSVRGIVSKGFLIFGLAAGAGYDRYTSDPSYNFALEYDCDTLECRTAKQDPTAPFVLTMADDISGELTTSAWNVFGNVSMSMFLLNLVGEIGYQKAMDVLDSDDLDTSRQLVEEELGGGRLFGSVGLRLSI